MRPDGQELPAAVLVEVLQHVPLSERLSSCALVCRAWAAASAAATVELEIDLAPAQFPSFQSFVRQHSMQLLALKVSLPDERPWGKDPFNRTDCRLGPKPHSRLLQLPCEQLQQLEDLALCRVFPELPPMQGQQQQQAAAALDSSPFQHLKDLMLRRLFQTSQPPMAGPQQGQQGQQWRQEQQQVLDPDSHPLQQQDADMQHISTGKSGGSSSSSSLPAADSSTLFLPHLTQLTLQYCHLSSSIHLLQLSKLQSLEEFTMLSLTVDVGDRDACRDCITNALSAAFQSMPKLLRCMVLDTLVYPSVFTALPSCLQELHIRINCDSSWGFDGKTSGFVCLPLEATQLTSLEYLNLDGVDFNPSVLLYMPQLVDIDLTDVDLERIPPGPLAADHVKLLKRDAAPGDVVVNPSCEVSVFLVAVGGLQHLQRLKLYSTHINDRNTAPLQLFSCLTASTCLTELDICLQGEQQPLPQGAVQRMFPAGRSFTQRQSLSIWSDVCYRGVCQEGSEGPHWWAIDAAGMRSILQACPNPVSLNIQSTVKPGDISPLLQLPTSCVSLSVGGRAFDDTAAAVVAQPTHLTELKWFSSPGLTDAGLEQLTALTGLHSVNMDGMPGLSEGVSVPSARLVFQNEQPAARMIDISSEERDVWLRLQALCNQMPVNASWKRRLQLQQEENELMKQQNADLQQRIAELEQQLATAGAAGSGAEGAAVGTAQQ